MGCMTTKQNKKELSLTYPLKFADSVDRMILDYIHATRGEIASLNKTKKYFSGDVDVLRYKRELLSQLESMHSDAAKLRKSRK